MKKILSFVKLVIFTTIITSLFFSCNEEKPKPSVYDTKILKKKVITLEEGDSYWYNSQLVEIDNANILVFSVNSKKLSFYDIDKGKKTHEIILDTNKILNSFYYINKDSILILYKCFYPVSIEDESENQMQLIDYNGKIKTKFRFDVADTKWIDKIGLEKLLPLIEFDVAIGNNAFFTTFSEQNGDLGTKEFLDNPLPFLMRYNFKEQKFYVSDTNSFPNIKEGDYYPTSLNVKYFSESVNGFPVIRYLYSSDIFEWDYKNDKLITHKLKSRLLDSVEPFAKPTRYHFNKLKNGFLHVHFDKYRKLYFLDNYYSDDFYYNGTPMYSAIIANEKFEYLGEIYCKSRPSSFTKNDMLSIISINECSAIEITYYELIKTDRDFESYIDSCKKDIKIRREKMIELKKPFEKKDSSVLNFLKSKKEISIKDYTVLTIYPTSGCIGCNDFMYNLISEMKSDLQYLPFYLIMSDDNIDYMNKELRKYDIRGMKNLYIDSLGTIKKNTVHDGLFNPRLIVVRDNKVKLDTIYKSEDTGTSLRSAFLASFGLCSPKKKNN